MTGSAFETGWKRAAITAVVAYALVVQAFLLSFGGALHAAPVDASQGIFCAWDAESGSDHAPAKAHEGLCCILGCGVTAGAAAAPPAVASLDRLPPVPAVTGSSYEAPLLRLASNVLPVGSRAPPRLG